MAISLRCLFRSNFKLLNNNILSPLSHNVTRSIYSPSALGMDGYTDTRKNTASRFQSVSETFRAKMTEFIKEENKSLIFTEDLKAMLHIVENNENDINLLVKMLTKYNAQNNELRFGNYVFGPIVMRAFYFLDVPDVALQMFKDSTMSGFFDQLTSYQILLSLLFKHNKFAEMRETYDIIKTKNTGNVVHPHNSILILLAGCYKENTPESFQYAMHIWSDLRKRGYEATRKSVCLMALLSIRQGKPEFAIEFLSNFALLRHIDIRCTKIEAFTACKRFVDIYHFLSKMLQSDKFIPGTTKPITFFKDTIENLEKALQEDGPGNEDLQNLINEMKVRSLIQDKTLRESLLQPIERRPLTDKQNDTSRVPNRRNFQDFEQAKFSMRR